MASEPNFKEGLEENGRSEGDTEIMEVDGNSQLSSSTTVTTELEDENRPQILIRDFSEIAEKSDEDEEEDDIVIIDEVKGSSPTRALKGLVTMTLDDGSTLLELTEDGGRDLASRFAADKRLQHCELKVQLRKMKKAMIERSKLGQNLSPPPTTRAPSQPLIRITPSVPAAIKRFLTPGQSIPAAPPQVFSIRHPVPASRVGLVRPRVIRPSGNGVGIRQPPPVQVRPAASLEATGVSLVTTDASNNVVTVSLSDYKIVHPTCTVQHPHSLIPARYGVLLTNFMTSTHPQSAIRLGNTTLFNLPSGVQVRQVNQHQLQPPPLRQSIVTIHPTEGRAPPQPILPQNDSGLFRPRNSAPRPEPRGLSAQENQEDNLIITAGTKLPGDSPSTTLKTYPSLVIHVKPCLHVKPTASDLSKARRELDSKVKQQLLLSPTKLMEWLMSRGLLKIDHHCSNHPHFPMKLGKYTDATKEPLSGSYVWTSDCCPQTQLSVFIGSIFEGCKVTPGAFLTLIYHWACQTPMDNVLRCVKVPSIVVKDIYGLLRAACILWLHEKCGLLGGEGNYVEMAMVTLEATGTTPKGNRSNTVEILGVFDPLTRVVRLKVINVAFGKTKEDTKTKAEEEGARAFQILWALSHWVDKRSVLLVDEFIDKTLFYELGFLRVVQTSPGTPKKAEEPSNANIANYLRHYVPRLFVSTMAVMTKNITQEFLDELCWREQWGSTSLLTFENIITQLVEETKWEAGGMGLLERLSKVNDNPFLDWSITTQGQRSPLVTIPLTIRSKPGIRECIQHIMNKKIMSTAVPSITSTKRKESPSPSIALVPTPTRDSTDYQRKMLYFNEAKKELNLDHYYYGRLPSKPPKSCSQSKFTLLKCPLCPTAFSLSNRDIVRHLREHVLALQKISEGSLCDYCLKPFYSTLKEHLNEVHFFVGCPFVCWICRVRFESEQELTIHMWTLHVEAEAPYSCEVCELTSSIHSEVIDHFGALHGDIEYVICPHCLKVLPAKSQTNLGSIVAHLQRHLKRETKCSKCVLSFGIDSELQLHLVKCHSSKRDELDWEQRMISKQNPIFMAMPPVPSVIRVQSLPPQIKPRVQKQRKVIESQSIPAIDSVAVPIVSLNAPLALPVDKTKKFGRSMFPIKMSNINEGKAKCFECGKDIKTPNHFVGRLSCNKCRYSTSCEAAMNLHHEKKHDGGGKGGNVNFNQVELMAQPLACKCGFSSENPYELAEHLVNCEKYTAFPVQTPDENDVDVEDDHEAQLVESMDEESTLMTPTSPSCN